MEITKENSKLIFEKFATVLNSIFPGVVVLELFFNIGFFSTKPDSTINFLLYLFWCIIFSIPFSFFNHEILESFMKHTFRVYGEVNNHTTEEISELYDELTEDDKEVFGNYDEQINFGAILIKTIILYLLFKIVTYYELLNYRIFDIPSLYLKAFILLFFTQVIAYPIGYLFAKINLYKLKNHFKKEDF